MYSISAIQAVQIFKFRTFKINNKNDFTNEIADKFKITTKSVRDIWNLRTWKKTTYPFWSDIEKKNKNPFKITRGRPNSKNKDNNASFNKWFQDTNNFLLEEKRKKIIEEINNLESTFTPNFLNMNNNHYCNLKKSLEVLNKNI